MNKCRIHGCCEKFLHTPIKYFLQLANILFLDECNSLQESTDKGQSMKSYTNVAIRDKGPENPLHKTINWLDAEKNCNKAIWDILSDKTLILSVKLTV